MTGPSTAGGYTPSRWYLVSCQGVHYGPGEMPLAPMADLSPQSAGGTWQIEELMAARAACPRQPSSPLRGTAAFKTSLVSPHRNRRRALDLNRHHSALIGLPLSGDGHVPWRDPLKAPVIDPSAPSANQGQLAYLSFRFRISPAAARPAGLPLITASPAKDVFREADKPQGGSRPGGQV